MSRRYVCLSMSVAVGLGILFGCGKKPAQKPDVEGKGEPTPVATVPANANTEHVLFAHLSAKAIREGTLFAELKQAIDKNGVTKLWNQVESEASDEIGFKPTELDSVTVVVAEVSPQSAPIFIAMIVSSKPILKGRGFGIEPNAKPDARGFYKSFEGLVHYPDDKTVVLLNPELTDKYLNGYAKDRNAWPFSAELTKAASGHTAFAIANVQKLPIKELGKDPPENIRALLAAKIVTLTADLKGKVLTVNGRASFPDAAAAARAKIDLQPLIQMLAGQIEAIAKADPAQSRELAALDAFKPAIQEARRAIKDIKLDVAGSDLTLSGSYAANFDLAGLVAAVVKETKEAAPRIEVQNNLKQLALSLMIFNDAMGKTPIHGIGKGGMPLKAADEKPLLSWRVGILPYIEQGALYKQFKLDEPWDSEHNKKLIDKMPKLFAPAKGAGKPGYTRMQMVVGPRAMQLPSAKFPASIQDGTSNTIALVEAAEPVIWTKPDDVMFPGKELPKDFRKKFGGEFPGGFYAVMWDGSVRFVSDKVSDETLSRALSPADGKPLGRDW